MTTTPPEPGSAPTTADPSLVYPTGIPAGDPNTADDVDTSEVDDANTPDPED